MSQSLYLVNDRELLKSMAAIEAGFHPPSVVLDGLTEEQAMKKPYGLPHSIADIVSHMCFWQEYFNRAATDGFSGVPEHAAEGWPGILPGEWDALRERFFRSIETTQGLAATSPTLNEKLLPDSLPVPFLRRESIGSGLLHAAVHSAHHLGQVVTLRQLMGLWPPRAGSMTW